MSDRVRDATLPTTAGRAGEAGARWRSGYFKNGECWNHSVPILLTSATIIGGGDGLIVLDPMETANRMRIAMADFVQALPGIESTVEKSG